ncbi:hypothetical protein C474_03180 [Halogeometricum pallidum JCM 14848]|uniref:Uncharacterized protein n=1 Tax=Halogeometricum pallidum JCM 14848 TaxID=1227487 RepID=M0DIC3_HALPD|nr:hypothetical protein [Halogeometricum pallidum]ELZ33929.1 hypothetical protein C474_03180 [Halogeometricum pallidum JCM 14848]
MTAGRPFAAGTPRGNPEADRYTFEPFVESGESARRTGGKLREIFREGITVYGGDKFQQIRTEVVSSE